MPAARVNGIDLYYEEAGAGTPLVFSHEFAGSVESWEPQLDFFARRYRCIAYNHRGYPPSTVPDDPAAYSEEQLVDDLRGLLDALEIQRAHICGLSMGGAVALKFAIAHPDRCLGVVVAGAGGGSGNREQWQRDALTTIRTFEEQGTAAVAEFYTRGPARVQYLRKDPRGWQRFYDLFRGHSARGSALTMRGVQLKRRTVFEVEDELARIQPSVCIMVGDEDETCLEPALLMKRRIPNAGLWILPKSGHAINLEEPGLFNDALLAFLTAVEQGRWLPRAEVSTSLLPAGVAAERG
ncbi:MAG TPA: alpha/beta fold hydrolase [Dehalococcoidia bacterium]|nr:alpha/beta fold hydrolase [Dehalococcoidia bacterium]